MICFRATIVVEDTDANVHKFWLDVKSAEMKEVISPACTNGATHILYDSLCINWNEYIIILE